MKKEYVILGDLIIEEAKRLKEKGWVYCDFPYGCGLDESLSYAKGYAIEKNKIREIIRNEKVTRVYVGRKKKPILTLWVS